VENCLEHRDTQTHSVAHFFQSTVHPSGPTLFKGRLFRISPMHTCPEEASSVRGKVISASNKREVISVADPFFYSQDTPMWHTSPFSPAMYDRYKAVHGRTMPKRL
jgi:hypothetical protein